MSNYRNVFVLIVAIGLLQVGGGILGVVTPLGLELMGLNGTMIGAIAALFALGFMIGAWTAPRAIAAVGNIRVFAAAAGVVAVGAMLMGLETHPLMWTPVRAVQGLGMAWMFASAESWLSSATPAQARGRVLGLYHVVAKAALLGGPFIVAGLPALDTRNYLWIAMFIALALVPVCLTRRGEPVRPQKRTMGPVSILKVAPAALWGAFLAGVINTGTLAILPVYAQRMRAEDSPYSATSIAALAMAAAWLGGLISQWPVGRLSDHVDRRLVVAGMGCVSAAAACVLGFMTDALPTNAILALLAVWGAGSLSFYGVAIAHGVDRTEEGDVAALMSGLLFVWAAGSVIGPPLAGLSLRIGYGEGGLFLCAGGLTVLLVLAMLFRRSARGSVPADQRSDWEHSHPTSVQQAEIDPRTEP